MIAGRTDGNGQLLGNNALLLPRQAMVSNSATLCSRNPRSFGTRAATRRNPPTRPLLKPKGQGRCYCAEELLVPGRLGAPMQHQSQTGILLVQRAILTRPNKPRVVGTGRPLTPPARNQQTSPGYRWYRPSFDSPHKSSHDHIGTRTPRGIPQ